TAAAAEAERCATAEQTDVGELIQIDHRDGCGLPTTHGKAGHRAVVLVGERAEVAIDQRNQIVDHDLAVRSAGRAGRTTSRTRGARSSNAGSRAPSTSGAAGGRDSVYAGPAARGVRRTGGAGLHDYEHGLHFAGGKQVVEDRSEGR